MSNIVVPKTEYQKLRQQAEAYRQLASKLFEAVLQDPIEEIVSDFRKTNLYTKSFLKDIETGLRKSSYAQEHGYKAAAKRS